MGASEESLALLRSIDTSLKALVRNAEAAAGPILASDADLDGKYGDEDIKFDPRDWTGDTFKHSKMSECPAPFLDLYAEAKDYFARKGDEEGKRTEKGTLTSVYDRKSSARARGWAARIRAGKVKPVEARPEQAAAGWADDEGAPPEPFVASDDDIPF